LEQLGRRCAVPNDPYTERPNTFVADIEARKRAEAAATRQPGRPNDFLARADAKAAAANRQAPHPPRTGTYTLRGPWPTGDPDYDMRRKAFALAGLRLECDRVRNSIPHTNRDDVLNTALFNVYRFVTEDGVLTEDEIVDAMYAASYDVSEPLPERQIREKLSGRILADRQRKPRAKQGMSDDTNVHEVTAETLGGTTQDEDAMPDDEQPDSSEPTWTFVDGATFILDIPARIPALWGHGTEVAWAEGESLMIAAPLGLGKTTLGTLLLRAQLGIGDGFLLGHPVPPRDGIFLYLAMDRPAQVARAMHRQFTEDEREVLAERLVVWKGPPPTDVAKDPTLLARMADAAGAGTLYLDSVKDAAVGLSDDEVGAGYNRARQHLLSQGVELCEQHHCVKRGAGGGPPLTVADVYGSAWITSGTGSIILLTGDPGDPIIGFRHLRSPADAVGPYQLMHDQGAGTLAIHRSTDLLELVKCKAEDGLTAKEAAAAIFDTGKPTDSEIEKARRKLNKLADDGYLTRVDGTKGRGQGNTTAWFTA
jgi:hypothetical protein